MIDGWCGFSFPAWMRKRISSVCTLLAVALSLPSPASAQRLNASIDVVSTYDFPDSTVYGTYGYGIANKGTSVGQIRLRKSDGHIQGYERRATGAFRTIVFPGAVNTFPEGINNSGLVCGYVDFFPITEGFFYDGQTYTVYNPPGSTFTEIYGINDNGDFVGSSNATGELAAFATIGGTATSFAVPGGSATQAHGINNLGQIVGYYFDSVDVSHGFFRDTDGTLTYPIDLPGGAQTYLTGINDRGLVVGSAVVGFALESLALYLPNRFITFQYTGASFGAFEGVNNFGLISGWYVDNIIGSGKYHGILAQFSP